MVDLQKGQAGLGLSLAGNRDRNKMSVFVCGLHPQGSAFKDGRIQVGDEILEVRKRGKKKRRETVSSYFSRVFVASSSSCSFRLTLYPTRSSSVLSRKMRFRWVLSFLFLYMSIHPLLSCDLMTSLNPCFILLSSFLSSFSRLDSLVFPVTSFCVCHGCTCYAFPPLIPFRALRFRSCDCCCYTSFQRLRKHMTGLIWCLV